MTGLTAAHRLSVSGHQCDVYERWPGLGGQVATLDVGEGVLLERYYHHLFTSDRHIASLYDEVGLNDGIEWVKSSVAVFRDGESYSFTSPLDLLRFKPLSPWSRLRMGFAAFMLQRRTEVAPFEAITAHHWILNSMGAEPWEKVWGPLLRGKFGDRAEDISMAWLWRRLTVRRQIKGKEARQEMLGYPRGSWQPFLDRLRAQIESRGGRVLIDRPAASIGIREGRFRVASGAPDSFRRGHDPRAYESGGEPEFYDAVVATVPNDTFRALLEPEIEQRIDSGYIDRLASVEYHAALCVLLELDRSFSPYYWTNIADPEIPFVGLVEQTNLIEAERYGGRYFLYIANYLAPGDPLLELSHDELVGAYEAGLRRVNPSYDPSWIRARWTFQEPDAQPIVTVGYQKRIPPLETGVPGLVLANTTQVYPEDRGTNYSVELGERAAAALTAPSSP
jgi:protoporphyrinogen oxidase